VPRSRVTIRDVASHAGVSHQTVSRVINNSERVSPETRLRVESAIKELGYRPNAIARFMAEGRTRTFACIAPNLSDYTFASIIEGAQREARARGYFVLTASALDEDDFASLVDQIIISGRTEGLMLINPYLDNRYSMLPEKFPTVFLAACPEREKVNSVTIDDFAAAQIATRHLIELGHQQIAMITGPLAEDCTQNRIAGYHSVLREAGLEANQELIIEGDWTATSGLNAVQKFLSSGIPYTAIFAQNDRMAVGAIRALREAELHVPDNISVIGFDDMPLAAYFDPPLTTIRQDMHRIGRQAVRMLIQAMESSNITPQHVRLPAKLVVRKTTKSLDIQ
jgi:DNA-binding LacI/PurR family transcriptional regulator